MLSNAAYVALIPACTPGIAVRPSGRSRVAYSPCMVVLLHLDEKRLERVGWRLHEGRRFSVAIPERTLVLGRQWQLCLVIADRAVAWDGSELVADDGHHSPSAIALGRVRSSPRPTTTDDRIVITESLLIDPLSVAALISATVTPNRREVRAASRTQAAALNDAAAESLVDALGRLRPDLLPIIENLRRGRDAEAIQGEAGEVLVMERDAVRLAMSIAGLDPSPLQEWNGLSRNGFLASLAYSTPEDVLVSHDASRFPDWTAEPGGRPDWIAYGDGQNHMRIGNVNKTKLENTLGVDLIYHHLEADTLVLVQYKRMRKDARGEWFYRPDKQLHEELDRMRPYDRRGMIDDSARTWRLHPRGFVIKLVRQPTEFDPRSDRLLPGLYLPLEYFDELLVDDRTLTKRGARRLGYDTIDRYLTGDLFVDLVRQGWIGTRGLTTRAIGNLIEAAVGAGRSVIVAEERGEQPGAIRRRRPARG